jgi:serine/threonine protein kinase
MLVPSSESESKENSASPQSKHWHWVSPSLGGGTQELIGKVMAKHYAVKEYEKIIEFKRIDPSEKFGVYGSAPQKIDPKKFEVGAGGFKEIKKCNVEINVNDAYQLTLARATGDLQSLQFDQSFAKANFDEIWSSGNLKNLCEGLFLYHSHGLVHLDIKPYNVVFFAEKSRTRSAPKITHPKKFAFIDFGLSTYTINIDSRVNNTPLDYKYLFYPVLANVLFRRKLMSDAYEIHTRDLTYDNVINVMKKPEVQNYMKYNHNKNFSENEKWVPNLVYSPEDDWNNFVTTYFNDEGTTSSVRPKMAKATDLYGLAMVICYVVYKATGMVYNDKLKSFDNEKLSIDATKKAQLAEFLSKLFHFQITTIQCSNYTYYF